MNNSKYVTKCNNIFHFAALWFSVLFKSLKEKTHTKGQPTVCSTIPGLCLDSCTSQTWKGFQEKRHNQISYSFVILHYCKTILSLIIQESTSSTHTPFIPLAYCTSENKHTVVIPFIPIVHVYLIQRRWTYFIFTVYIWIPAKLHLLIPITYTWFTAVSYFFIPLFFIAYVWISV